MLAVIITRVDPLSELFWTTTGIFGVAVLLAVFVGPLAGWLAYEWPKVRSWWGRRTVRRLFKAGMLALLLSTALSVAVQADDGEFLIPDWCVGSHPCRMCLDAGLPWSLCIWLSRMQSIWQ